MAKVCFGLCLLLLASHVRAIDNASEAESGECPDEFVALQTGVRADVDVLCEFSKLLSYEPLICDKTSDRWMSLRSTSATYGDINMMARYKATHKSITMPPDYKKPYGLAVVCMRRPRHASGQGRPPSIGFLIPKVASSSLRGNVGLTESGFVEGPCSDMSNSFIMDPEVVRFAVVRDPVSRLASAFNQLSHEVMMNNWTTYASVLRDPAPLDPSERFAQFLEDVLVPGKVDSTIFTIPQTKILLQIGPDESRLQLPELDFLVSMDRLDEYMPELGGLLGFESKPNHISHGVWQVGKLDSNEVWQALAGNPLAARRFCDQYALDYSVFGFKLPSWCSTASLQSRRGNEGTRR
jgi:hypothetical protein